MSKSLEYALEKAPNYYKRETAIEKIASIYMDWILQGQREKVKETPVGIIKTVIEFDPNADFNYLNSWGGECYEEYSQEEVDNQILFVLDEELNDNVFYVPVENNEPLGGWPTNGDTLHVTFGNLIINIKNEQHPWFLSVALPMKYKLIKGAYHE